MPNNNLQTDPQALFNFARELESYLNELIRGITDLESEHVAMGEYWRDAQYKEMSDVVADFKDDVLKIKKDLDSLIDQTRKKAIELADVQGVTIRG